MGLVSFSMSASIAQLLTGNTENFRHPTTIDTLKASGDTSLWDALALAVDKLTRYDQTYTGISEESLLF